MTRDEVVAWLDRWLADFHPPLAHTTPVPPA